MLEALGSATARSARMVGADASGAPSAVFVAQRVAIEDASAGQTTAGTLTAFAIGPVAIRVVDPDLRHLSAVEVIVAHGAHAADLIAWRPAIASLGVGEQGDAGETSDSHGAGNQRIAFEDRDAPSDLPHSFRVDPDSQTGAGAEALPARELAARHRRALEGLAIARDIASRGVVGPPSAEARPLRRGAPASNPLLDSAQAARSTEAAAQATAQASGQAAAQATGQATGWLRRIDDLPRLEAMEIVAWLEMADARQALLRSLGRVAEADSECDRVLHYLGRLGAVDTAARWRTRVPRRSATPLSATLHATWPFEAWEIVERATTVAEAQGATIAAFLGIADSLIAELRLAPELANELRDRMVQASTKLPLGTTIAGPLARDLIEHLRLELSIAASEPGETALETVRTAVWESWARTWNEPGAIAPMDRESLGRQRAQIAERVQSAMLASARDADESEWALAAAAAATEAIAADLDNPWNAWALLPFDESLMEKVLDRIDESTDVLQQLDDPEDRDQSAFRNEGTLLGGSVLTALAVEFAINPRERARRIPFPDALPSVNWRGGPVRCRLSTP
ncbi:MAG: hypothetical protein U0575_17375 [Phycisphaerales bacterium]